MAKLVPALDRDSKIPCYDETTKHKNINVSPLTVFLVSSCRCLAQSSGIYIIRQKMSIAYDMTRKKLSRLSYFDAT